MKFTRIFLIIICFYTLDVKGQQKEMGLLVGDSLPIFTIPKVINSVNRSESTANYKNKLLIIDFWGTGCSSCIEAMPKMEQLEKEFAPKLKILAVTNEKEQYIKDFWKSNKYTRDLNTPTVVEDSLFNHYFKHRLIPHEVWIYENKIIAITSMEYVDEYNINRVLNGQKINWPVKNDFYTSDRNNPIFQLDENQIDIHKNSIQYAAVSDFRKKNNSTIQFTGGTGIKRDSLNKTVRTFFFNQPILTSYQFYWTMLKKTNTLIKPSPFFQANQIQWQVTNKNKYMFEKRVGEYSQDWLEKNAICFESFYPDTGQNNNQIYQSVISDLDRLLGLKVGWERKKEKVLVLKGTYGTGRKIRSKGYLKYSISDILYNLNEQGDNPYVFNEIKNINNIKIALNIKSWNDLENISKGLRDAGLTLKEEDREVDKFVVREVDSKLIDREMQIEAQSRRLGQESLKEVTAQENQDFFVKNKMILGVKETASGLQYKVIRQGNGGIPLSGDKVKLHYEGKLINGKIFDSTYASGIPTELNIDGLVKGWSEALKLMREGGIWEIYIPASLAYGSHTGNGRFPPNSALIFKMELIEIIH